MKKGINVLFSTLLLSVLFLSSVPLSFAASGDLVLSEANVWFSTSTFLEGNPVRIRSSVQNNSPSDLLGTVKFSSEKGAIGTDQPISALAGKTDEVFVDWTPSTYGTFNLTISVVPWDATSDNPNNNTVYKQITVLQDTDYDGIPNSSDLDRDGDGVNNEEDAFPLTKSESKDTDGDGQGNTADLDDDNDGTPDTEDEMPEDSRYTKDQDKDGISDEEDADIDGDELDNSEEADFETDPKDNDTDDDGTLDGVDAFPTDSSEWNDVDSDEIGDNSDEDIDGDGEANATDVDPSNPAPTAEVNQDIFIANLEDEVVFDGSASQDDSNIIKYVWSFGDEDTKEGPRVTHSFDATGLQVATLTVYDENGQSDSLDVKVRILDYKFLAEAFLFALLLLLLAFYIIYRYTPRRSAAKAPKKAAADSHKKKKNLNKPRRKRSSLGAAEHTK